MLDYPVVTPENVSFHYTLAGPGTRMMAWLIDLGVVVVLLSLLGAIFGLAGVAFGGYAEGGMMIASFLVTAGYWIVLEHRWQGQTLGKRALGLRVVGRRGLRLDLSRVVLRNLLRFVDLLPGLAGAAGVVMVLHPEHRRLGDLVAGTLVVRERSTPAPERLRSVLGPDARGPSRRVLPLEGRRRIPGPEREFLLDLCLRRDALDDAVRMQLFAEVAEHLRARVDLPREDGLSDEKLVLLVCAELFGDGDEDARRDRAR